MNQTADRSVMEIDTRGPQGRIPIITGACFNLWNPDAGEPFAYGRPDVLRPYLLTKLARAVNNTRSAYRGLRFTSGKLPLDSARITFRDIARATDSRTMICALLPPGTAAVHKAPLVVRRGGGAKAEAALLGIMSSVPFDWVSRRWVELTMSFELLNAFPVPRPDLEAPLGRRIVVVAGRLGAIDDRYADWAAEVGVPVGSVTTQAQKDDLIAELDALVSLLYGLTEDQVEHVFATFHRGWAYEARLDAVLTHYRVWKGKA
jgi:hypothetical protein